MYKLHIFYNNEYVSWEKFAVTFEDEMNADLDGEFHFNRQDAGLSGYFSENDLALLRSKFGDSISLRVYAVVKGS
jgi:hypothetical protein